MVLRELLARYRPLIQVLKRAGYLFGMALIFFTALPTAPDAGPIGWPNALWGWLRQSLAVWVLRGMERQLLPHGVTLIVVGPFDAFTVVLEVGFYLALIVTIPYLIYGLFHWLSPGLKPREVRAVRYIFSLAGFLFLGGVLFTYLIILPPLYSFSQSLSPLVGAEATISIQSFVETTFLFLIGIGLGFEIPPVCLGLSYAGVLNTRIMATQWNYAGIACFVVAFMISPGVGGGVIETLIALGLWSLYGLSYLLVRRVERSRRWVLPMAVT